MSIPVNLSLCGVDLKIQGIDNAMLDVEAKLAELTSGAKGLAGNLSSIQGDIQAKMAAMQAELEGLIPDIKPELPNLQAEVNKLLGQLSSPTGFSAQLAAVKEKFGNIPGVDIDSIVGELRSNPLAFDPCKAVPNIDVEETVDEDGVVIFIPIKKGLAPEVPIVDAKKLPDPPAAKKTEDVTPTPDKSVGEKSSLKEKQTVGATVPPPTNSVTIPGKTITVPTPPLLQAVFDALDKVTTVSSMTAIRPPHVFRAGTIGRNKSAEFEEDGAEFWKPVPFPSQLTYEEFTVQLMFSNFIYVKRRIKQLNDTDPDVLKSLQEENPDKWSVSNYQAAKDAIIAFVRNGRPKANGPNGTYTFISNKRATVNREQALRSAVPKPDGSFGKSSILV